MKKAILFLSLFILLNYSMGGVLLSLPYHGFSVAWLLFNGFGVALASSLLLFSIL